ncbi:response regulator [Glaciecola sp. MH2013]|uniref:response regulator n=1 Tax=Glaciecola sp. MH2013 TaxID=2785524 RepID=UPI00189EF94E|nr:response regulator [Glaciecola sp. MH2013]MBF7073193.1 response regulator [Glaciecola sp. MH2013]
MKKILLVDDSKTMLMSMEGVLKRAGFDVKTAIDGKTALATVPTFKPDLMITDLNMPGMDGIALIKEVKQTPAMRFKPILMLTTESQQSKRDEAKAAGATGWLVKPVQPADLTAVVKQVLPGA